jgi:MFS transporter, SP family, sugar:H+ symporter
MTKLCGCTMIPDRFSGWQSILRQSANLRGEPVLVVDNNELGNDQILSSFLGRKRDYVGLVLRCICYSACLKVADTPQKKLSFIRQWMRSGHDTSAIWRAMARNEQYLAFVVVLAALQLFLRLARVNVTILFLPMLSQAVSSRSSPAVIGNVLLVLVTSCGVLGSAFSAKQFGREVTFAIGAIVMVICQVTERRVIFFVKKKTKTLKRVLEKTSN